MGSTPDNAVHPYIQSHRAAFLTELTAWLRIPSVSADPTHAPDLARSATWLAEALKETGFPTTEVWDTPGAPAVFAHWPSDDPNAPTVLVYGHHDVQPAAREDGWSTPLDHPALRSLVRAMGRAFGQEIRFTREGGSGPAADLRDVLGVPVLFLGISVPSDGWHSVDEKVELDLLFKGVETAAYLWGQLAEDWRAEPWQRTTGK